MFSRKVGTSRSAAFLPDRMAPSIVAEARCDRMSQGPDSPLRLRRQDVAPLPPRVAAGRSRAPLLDDLPAAIPRRAQLRRRPTAGDGGAAFRAAHEETIALLIVTDSRSRKKNSPFDIAADDAEDREAGRSGSGAIFEMRIDDDTEGTWARETPGASVGRFCPGTASTGPSAGARRSLLSSPKSSASRRRRQRCWSAADTRKKTRPHDIRDSGDAGSNEGAREVHGRPRAAGKHRRPLASNSRIDRLSEPAPRLRQVRFKRARKVAFHTIWHRGGSVAPGGSAEWSIGRP